jgi:DNA-binding transcriptional ArsR family regulator
MARAAVPDPHSHPVLPSYRLPAYRRTLPLAQASDCVVALRALGEETRVRIIALLIDHSRDVTEISNELGVSPYNVSKHLRVLREAGLLEVERDGRQRLYALPDAIRRHAAAGKVLDLGCCSFQFDAPAAEAQKGRTPPAVTRKRKVRR